MTASHSTLYYAEAVLVPQPQQRGRAEFAQILRLGVTPVNQHGFVHVDRFGLRHGAIRPSVCLADFRQHCLDVACC